LGATEGRLFVGVCGLWRENHLKQKPAEIDPKSARRNPGGATVPHFVASKRDAEEFLFSSPSYYGKRLSSSLVFRRPNGHFDELLLAFQGSGTPTSRTRFARAPRLASSEPPPRIHNPSKRSQNGPKRSQKTSKSFRKCPKNQQRNPKNAKIAREHAKFIYVPIVLSGVNAAKTHPGTSCM